MNKTELVAAIAEKTDLPKKDAEKALKAFTDVVTEELKKGEKIQLELLKFLRGLQEREGILRAARRWRFRLPRLRSLRQEKL